MSRGGARRTGARRGGHGTGDKTEAFWDSIDSENVKTLFWSLKYGGFGPTKPYDDDNTPPIHYAVQGQKLKSLKCILESIDRMRSQKDVDFPWEDGDGLTPLMLAAQQNWVQGVEALLENGADLKRRDPKGWTAKQHAEAKQSKSVLKFLEEWESDTPVAELSEAEKAKKAEIVAKNKELSEQRAAEQRAHEAELAKRDEEKEKLKENIKMAATSAAWPEVREALADLKKELFIKKLGAEDGTEIDPSLWKLATLQVLELRMKKEALTVLPPDLGALKALTDLNVSHNSLQALPEEIKELTGLKVFAAEFNCLTSLPEGMSALKKLEVVTLNNNQLTSLAPLAPVVANMTILYASNNPLSAIDLPVDKCVRLRTLTASSNQLTALPPKMGSAVKLTVLKMAHNKITEISDELGDLKDLQEVDLEGNPLKDKKILKILEGGNNPVKDFRTYLNKNKKKK